RRTSSRDICLRLLPILTPLCPARSRTPTHIQEKLLRRRLLMQPRPEPPALLRHPQPLGHGPRYDANVPLHAAVALSPAYPFQERAELRSRRRLESGNV